LVAQGGVPIPTVPEISLADCLLNNPGLITGEAAFVTGIRISISAGEEILSLVA